MVESAGFINFLQDLKFIKVGSWELIHGEVHHSIKVEIKTSVYLWVGETKNSEIIPLYVGKAGSSLKKRMNEHLNGFKERKSGKKKRDVLKTLLEQNVKVNKFLRMKINLQTQCSFSKEDFYNTPHLDRLDELKYFNAIYYVNDSDGDTFFFKKENNKYLITDKVSPKKGRLVVFDGDKYHSGRHPKESLKRVIINFNFL